MAEDKKRPAGVTDYSRASSWLRTPEITKDVDTFYDDSSPSLLSTRKRTHPTDESFFGAREET